MNNERNNAEAIINKILELENALAQMTMTILGDEDECPKGYEWWDEYLEKMDNVLTAGCGELSQRYGISPEEITLKVINQ